MVPRCDVTFERPQAVAVVLEREAAETRRVKRHAWCPIGGGKVGRIQSAQHVERECLGGSESGSRGGILRDGLGLADGGRWETGLTR